MMSGSDSEEEISDEALNGMTVPRAFFLTSLSLLFSSNFTPVVHEEITRLSLGMGFCGVIFLVFAITEILIFMLGVENVPTLVWQSSWLILLPVQFFYMPISPWLAVPPWLGSLMALSLFQDFRGLMRLDLQGSKRNYYNSAFAFCRLTSACYLFLAMSSFNFGVSSVVMSVIDWCQTDTLEVSLAWRFGIFLVSVISSWMYHRMADGVFRSDFVDEVTVANRYMATTQTYQTTIDDVQRKRFAYAAPFIALAVIGCCVFVAGSSRLEPVVIPDYFMLLATLVNSVFASRELLIFVNSKSDQDQSTETPHLETSLIS